MANMPTPDEIEAAEMLGTAAGERCLPASRNPWRNPTTGRERVLSWRWRQAWAGAGGSDAALFGPVGGSGFPESPPIPFGGDAALFGRFDTWADVP